MMAETGRSDSEPTSEASLPDQAENIEASYPVSIEPMLPDDMEAVLRIDGLCFPTPWRPNAFQTELSNLAGCYLVARQRDKILGYGGVWVIAEEAHITTLAVDPNHQRRKVGEKLLLALQHEAIYRGAGHTTLEVRESNLPARRLYYKFGFHEAALLRNYYTDNGENALVMWAVEINTPAYQQKLTAIQAALTNSSSQ